MCYNCQEEIFIGYVLLEKSVIVFLNLLDWNTTSIVQDIFIFPTKYKKIKPGRKKVLTLQKPVWILKKAKKNKKQKKNRIWIPDEFYYQIS